MATASPAELLARARAEVRAEVVRLAGSLLLGPVDANEQIASAPLDTYLTGVLWPEGQTLSAIEDEAEEGASTTADGEEDGSVPGYRSMRPCSIGLTFALAADAAATIDLGTTARYEPVTGEASEENGRATRKWVRRELGYSVALESGPAAVWDVEEFRTAAGFVRDAAVRLHVRRRIAGGQQVLTVTLINAAVETDDTSRDAVCLFQAQVRVAGADGARVIRPRPIVPQPDADEDARSAALLYREVREYAVGHGVSASWSGVQGGCAASVSTEWMPATAVSGTSADGHSSFGTFRAAHPRALEAAWLSDGAARDEVLPVLDAFVDAYETWIADSLTARLQFFEGELAAAALLNRDRCAAAASRMRLGVAVLAHDAAAWSAFALANEAMDRQSRYTIKGSRAAPLRWRPFQLAYIFLVLPGIVDPKAGGGGRDVVDLLWFPTGGGKTEAYLALTAFQIFLRRLTDAGRRADGGVDVLMRYTLRLLTVQQFQRAASLICACDALRVERGDLGDAPISLGLYVGRDATPNSGVEAREALREEVDGLAPKSTPRQLLECPVCGVALSASDYETAPDGTSIEIRCRDASCATAGRPIPVLTVDQHIYDAPPSLLIGTIDKFAQLPRSARLRPLFGLDGGSPPGLVIQDELHLISGPLGSMAGLYETIVDLLCTRDGVRPKVIGSTATIGQAARQVRALFDREVLQFPPSGFEAGDSFFAVTETRGPDRLYVGVSSAGRSPKFALQAVSAALLQATAAVRAIGLPSPEIDPYWTGVLYFNSLRELGGAYVLLQDDVPRQIGFVAGRLGLVPARALEHEPVELSSRVPSRELPQKLQRLGVDLARSEADPFAPPPEDVVLASNMISVGVDVPRLGLMIVNGQPKSTAEYIQASSRVGRGLPGLVVTVYNAGRPRDVSHFEHFVGYHAALYRAVEASSVTPWAPRARDKALHAVVAAVVRHLVSGMDDDDDAIAFDPSDPATVTLIGLIVARASSSSGGIEGPDAEADIRAIVREWAQRGSDTRAAGRRLLYWERRAPFGATLPHLMASAEEGARQTGLAWPTPNSMREVEPSTAFSLRTFRRTT
ncbi:helicase-related protein [Methylobacterium sp. Leaf117]|uniref:helicase-related protein n=1 Tax=Methylobacterium sp. Leaf117 TaxID=1736260 RepID=UPI0006FEE0CB|nr:helicase-related protein [Methylobacterium sp. Leaf117]KQP91926.1 helicase [Methylobacterium sp. Leaf117]